MRHTREKIPQHITLQDKNVPYILIMSSRARRMSIKIGRESGLEVVVPRRFNLNKIPRFIHEKEDWILKHLNKNEIKQKSLILKQFRDGAQIEILGESKTIRILPTRKKRSFVREARALKYNSETAYYDNKEILIYLPKTTPQESRIKLAKQTLEKHLRTQAKKFFQKRTTQIAEYMDLTFNRITIKAQKTRWGSCSKDKNLNFNWRIILTPIEVIDSIIIHELAHLKYLNHGPRFYAVVEKYCPNHKKLNRQLGKTDFML